MRGILFEKIFHGFENFFKKISVYTFLIIHPVFNPKKRLIHPANIICST